MAETEQLGHLVEGLAQRVVDGGAPALVVADAAHQHELAVPARDQQHQVGEGDAVGQPRGQRMRLEVVDRDQRLAERRGQRLGRGQPDQHAADQPRPGGRGDGVDIAERQPGLRGGAGDDAVEMADMGARREFGHHAAIGGVLLELAAHDVGEDGAAPVGVALDDGGGGFVAAGFDAQNPHVRLPGAVRTV